MSMEHDDVESNEISVSSSKRQCNTTSVFWDFYEKLSLDTNPGNRLRAKCKKCGIIFLAYSKAGTTNLKRHLAKHKIEASKQGTQIDHKEYRKMLAKAIVRHNLPFSYVEYEGVREVHAFLNPAVKTISRNTAKVDVLKLYHDKKEMVKNELEAISNRINLTSDLRSSITSNGYICVTAHYVDLDWVLQKRVLIFRHVPPPHSRAILGPKLINLLKEWGIEKKIFSITLDNASYNDGVVGCLIEHFKLMDYLLCNGDFVHIRCANHILNLIVKAGLKTIEGAIFNIRESIKYIKGSESRSVKFVECIKNLGLKLMGKVRQDVSTRWNYTYLMLDSAFPYRRAFSDFKILDKDFTCCPSDEDWVKAETIAKFLRPFYEIATLFSGSHYPTANLYFHKVWKIHMLIKEEIGSEDPNIKAMAMEMEKKFTKYWQDDYSPIASMAVALDPRYKLKLIKFCFSKLDPLTCNEKFKIVEDNLHRLFKEYMTIFDVGIVGSSSHGCFDEIMDEMDEFDMFESPSEYSLEKKQLDLFLEEPVLVRKGNENLDVLTFWKDNSSKYPELSLMACDLLSTVASESAFSVGGRVIDKFQSSILPENAEAKLCSRDWICGHQACDDSEEEDIAIDVEKIAFTIFT